MKVIYPSLTSQETDHEYAIANTFAEGAQRLGASFRALFYRLSDKKAVEVVVTPHLGMVAGILSLESKEPVYYSSFGDIIPAATNLYRDYLSVRREAGQLYNIARGLKQDIKNALASAFATYVSRPDNNLLEELTNQAFQNLYPLFKTWHSLALDLVSGLTSFDANPVQQILSKQPKWQHILSVEFSRKDRSFAREKLYIFQDTNKHWWLASDGIHYNASIEQTQPSETFFLTPLIFHAHDPFIQPSFSETSPDEGTDALVFVHPYILNAQRLSVHTVQVQDQTAVSYLYFSKDALGNPCFFRFLVGYGRKQNRVCPYFSALQFTLPLYHYHLYQQGAKWRDILSRNDVKRLLYPET